MARESGARILHWMRAEFDGMRSQLHALASSLAHQQALVSDLAGGRAKELNSALAELEGSATQLRTEATRMRRDASGLQEDGNELRNESAKLRDLERDLSERLPRVVAEVVQPELRAALQDVEVTSAGLRQEAAQLRSLHDDLTEQLPKLVEAAVFQALATYVPPAQVAQVAPVAPHPPPDTGPRPPAGPLADEPVEEAAAPGFGPPPAPVTGVVPADGGVGQEPLACTLPGLVVGPSMAVAVSESLRQAALRRRRRRRPGKPAPGLNRRDPFASDLTRRLDRYARARADLAAVRPAARNNGPSPEVITAVAAGFRDAEEVILDLAQAPGLVLIGPAVSDVARSLVASFLALAGPGRAVVVGDLLPPIPAFPGLSQPADVATALAELPATAMADGQPPVLLVAEQPPPAETEALAALVAGEGAGRIAVVLVEPGPERPPEREAGPLGMTTIWIDPAERVTEVDAEPLAAQLVGARLYTLGREPATELLTVLASARTDDEVMTANSMSPPEAFEVNLPEAPSVSVQLLGKYRIDVGGVEIRAGLRAKARELLAFYLLHPSGTTLDAAVEALWPEADPGRGSEWFWTALGNLRSRLRDATGQKKLKVIEREGDRYRVEPLFDVDLWRLEQAMGLGAAEADDFGRAAAYDRVATTYTGELLTGVDWAWVETPRQDLRQRVVDVLVWLGDVRWASGDARGSWQALQRAVEVDPYAEQIYRRIMRLQSKLGRPDDAAATFRRLQARLVEIELEPTPESAKLHAELTVL